jgi:hypothetical protein
MFNLLKTIYILIFTYLHKDCNQNSGLFEFIFSFQAIILLKYNVYYTSILCGKSLKTNLFSFKRKEEGRRFSIGKIDSPVNVAFRNGNYIEIRKTKVQSVRERPLTGYAA